MVVVVFERKAAFESEVVCVAETSGIERSGEKDAIDDCSWSIEDCKS